MQEFHILYELVNAGNGILHVKDIEDTDQTSSSIHLSSRGMCI